MEPEAMLEELKSKESELKDELLNIEKTFTIKKEQFLKVQGAIEALTLINPENNDD